MNKGQKKKTYWYCLKVGHVENKFWKKMNDLEGRVKYLEDFSLTGQLTKPHPKKYTFFLSTFKELHSHMNQTEWIVDSICAHHMVKDDSPFSSLTGDIEEKIYVFDDYTLTVVGNGYVECQHGHISDVYHVLSMITTLLSVSQLMKTQNYVEFLPDSFILKDLRG